MMINAAEYTIRMRDDLPSSVPAFIAESPDGHINIYLNSRLNHDKQREGLKHEIDHYQRDDLHNGHDIHTVEAKKHPEGKILPLVFRASQLLNKPRPVPVARIKTAPTPLTSYQRRILMTALSELDRFLFDDTILD